MKDRILEHIKKYEGFFEPIDGLIAAEISMHHQKYQGRGGYLLLSLENLLQAAECMGLVRFLEERSQVSEDEKEYLPKLKEEYQSRIYEFRKLLTKI